MNRPMITHCIMVVSLSYRWLYVLGFIGLLKVNTSFFLPTASAGELEEVIPLSTELGPRGAIGNCPTLRWSLHFKSLSGTWTTKTFSMTSEALFQYLNHRIPFQNRSSAHQLKFGALEILAQGGRIGLTFSGIGIGYDDDRSYSGMMDTGLSLVMNLIQTDAIRLGVRSGVDFERMRINLAPVKQEISIVDTLEFEWEAGRWDGSISASVGFPQEYDVDHTISDLMFTGNAGVRTSLFRIGQLQTGLSFGVAARHQPEREEYGLYPNEISATLLMDFSWVPKEETKRKN